MLYSPKIPSPSLARQFCMKNYDDLQRFKEKTQTQGINFRDMSGQSVEHDQQRWAIIQQLSEETNHDDVLETGQRIDRAQPQPVKSDAFSAPVVAQLLSARTVSTVSTGSMLLDSVAASPKPAAPLPSLRAQAAVQATPATGSLLQQISATALPSRPATPAPMTQPVPAAALPPAGMPPPPSAPGRFGGLFRTRAAEPVMLSKETLLKPLLEKIALCR